MNMERPKTPEEIAAIEKSHTLSDAELLKGGAQYYIHPGTNEKILILSPSQLESLRDAGEKEYKRIEWIKENAELTPIIERKLEVLSVHGLPGIGILLQDFGRDITKLRDVRLECDTACACCISDQDMQTIEDRLIEVCREKSIRNLVIGGYDHFWKKRSDRLGIEGISVYDTTDGLRESLLRNHDFSEIENQKMVNLFEKFVSTFSYSEEERNAPGPKPS